MAKTKNTPKKEVKKEQPAKKKSDVAHSLLDKLETVVHSDQASHYFQLVEEFIQARIAHAAETHPGTSSASSATPAPAHSKN